MAAQEAKTFVVIVPNYFGVGASISEALAKCMKAGFHRAGRAKVKAEVMALSCAPEAVNAEGFVGVEVRFPKDTVALRWVMDL